MNTALRQAIERIAEGTPLRTEAEAELQALEAKLSQMQEFQERREKLIDNLVIEYNTAKTSLEHLKKYFEENHAERIKYPEYLEFHEYKIIIDALRQA